MNRFEDRMLDRDLEESLGGDAPSDLRERILAAHTAPVRRRTGRVRALPPSQGRRANQTAVWGVAVVALSLVAALVVLWRNVATRPSEPAPGVAGGAQNGPANVQLAPKMPAPKTNEPVPQPKVEAPKPQPEALPEEPRPLPPSQPQPEPLPRPTPPGELPKPPEEVERPTPPSEGPKETQPKPSPTPKSERVKLGVVLAVPKGAKLQVRESESETWREADGDTLYAGAFLKVAHAVDLTLGDALVRFEGTLRLDTAEGAIRIDLIERKTQAWCDNLGGRTPLVFGMREMSATMNDGVAHFEAGSATLEIACIEGTVIAGNSSLESGRFGVLSAKGLSKPRELSAGERQPRLIAGMAARKLLREEFTEEPAGKIYGGTLKDGVARAEGQGGLIAFDINPTLIAIKGAKLRMRYRVNDCSSIYLQFLGEDVSRQFGNEFTQRKQGQWIEVEIRLDSLPFDAAGAGGEKMPAGLKLGKFQCYVRGEKSCTLEIDWLEIVRE
ncbi:hypothetical protein PLCT2_03055 [Planctomycetaceae bacterium]|nr:hypothetical protein PLCT2_03055 [Planctomycetaceae bacterium]